MTTAKKAKQREIDSQTQSLYFDAKRDMNPFWRSSLFSEVYLKNDIPREYKHIWEHDEIADETSGFYKFYDGFLDLVNKHEHSSFDNWKEAETVKNWIVPIMVLLGWDTDSKTEDSYYIDNESFTVTEKDKKQTYRPDLLYFDKPKHKTYVQNQNSSDKKLAEARDKKTGCKIVVEAKYWNRLSLKQTDSKKDKKVDDSAVGLGAELQTLKYMEIIDLDFGILTDGKTWKIFHKELSQGVDRRSYDFDLDRLRELALDVTSYGNEEKYKHYAKYFYYFFAKQSFVQGAALTTPFVYEVFNYSKKYALSIEENLKKRFIVAMGITCNALKNSCEEFGEEIDLQTIRNVAESHIFNILFVKSCEVRHVLPIRSVEYVKVSLHEVIESLDAMKFDPDKDEDDFLVDFQHGITFGGKKFTYDDSQVFDRFINLYEVIHDGTVQSKKFGFEIEGFKESIFSKDEWRFAKKHKINNRDMIRLLFTLNFIESEFQGRKFQQIPYSYFTPRQLGSIYESFLEYRLEKAESGMIFQKGQWQKANTKSSQVRNLNLVDNHVVNKGELFFSPNNEDRKMTGSYYTPDYIVKYIVENTIGQIVEKLSCKGILDLKVCDPAMGSGHFLSGALDFLVGAYRQKWCEENNDDLDESIEETARKILDSCLYGCDINLRAIKLAQLSMWLSTAMPGKKLERLNDQFISGDSLVEINWPKSFSGVFNKGGFDVVIGNPPYIDSETMILTQPGKREQIVDKYEVASGNWDLYVPFFELAFKISSNTADLAFIIPNKWLCIDYANSLRKYILSNTTKIVDCSKFKVFQDAGNNPLIWFASKKIISTNIEVQSFIDEKQMTSIKKFEKKELTNDWGILITDNPEIINKIKTINYKVEDSFIVESPCSVSEAYEIKKLLKNYSPREQGIFKLINTGTIDPYESFWGECETTYIKGRYLYPGLKKDEFKVMFPRRFDQAKSSKLIISGMRYFESYLDTDGEYLAGKSTVIIRSKSGIEELIALNAIFNSRLISYYLKEKFKSQGIDGGVSFTPPIIRQLPIVKSLLRNENLIELSKKAQGEVKKNRELFEQCLYKINMIIYKAYNLTGDEISTIEDSFKKKKKKIKTAA